MLIGPGLLRRLEAVRSRCSPPPAGHPADVDAGYPADGCAAPLRCTSPCPGPRRASSRGRRRRTVPSVSGAHTRQPPRTRRSPPLRGAGERRRASRSARRRASPERVHDAGNQRAEATRAAATSSTVAFSASPIAATARLGDWTSRRSGFTERPSSLGGEHLASFETELAPLWWGSHIELRRHPTSRGVPRVRDASGLQGLSTVDRCDRDRTTREPAVPGCRDRARSRQVRPDTAPVDDRLHPGSLETRVHLGGRRCVPGTQVR